MHRGSAHRWSALSLVAVLWAIAAPAGCAKSESDCATGACPVGYRCEASTGLCQLENSGPALQTSLFGAITAIAKTGGAPLVVGFAQDRQSLAVIDGDSVSFLAGPAASINQQPGGQVSAAVRTDDGAVHVAWLRDADQTLWHARGHGGTWKVEQVEDALPGTVARPLAIGWWQDHAVIAWRAGDAAAVRVGRKQASGHWKVDTLPPPPPPRKGAPPTTDMGRSLALATPAAGLTIASYDATHGDVLISVESEEGWSTARLVGTEPTTGADSGDVGLPLALAVGPDDEMVLAYRDVSRDSVMLARAAKGVLSHVQVADGTVAGPAGTQQADWIGSTLSVAVHSDGRAAVAWFNGSRWTVELALQTAAGGFSRVNLPAQLAGKSRQLWPALSSGSVIWLSWVAVDANRGPSGSRVVQWAVPAEAWK